MKPLALWLLWLLIRAYACLRPRFDIYVDGKLYLSRWYLTPYSKENGTQSAFAAWWRRRYPCYYLHCFHESDPNRGYHSHPFRFSWSLILRGEYAETRKLPEFKGDDPFQQLAASLVKMLGLTALTSYFEPGDVNRLNANDFHRVRLLTPRVWTLFCAGPLHGREWSFMSEDGVITPHGTPTPGD
jgi:hypothetical protein